MTGETDLPRSLGVGERRGEFEGDAVRIKERKERQAERYEVPYGTVLDTTFVEKPCCRVKICSRRHGEAEMVEPYAEGVEAIRSCGSFVVDRTQPEEHALVHQDHTTLKRIDHNLMVLVAGRRRGINRHLETEDLGVEGARPLDVRDGHPHVVDRTYRQVRHGSSSDRECRDPRAAKTVGESADMPFGARS